MQTYGLVWLVSTSPCICCLFLALVLEEKTEHPWEGFCWTPFMWCHRYPTHPHLAGDTQILQRSPAHLHEADISPTFDLKPKDGRCRCPRADLKGAVAPLFSRIEPRRNREWYITYVQVRFNNEGVWLKFITCAYGCEFLLRTCSRPPFSNPVSTPGVYIQWTFPAVWFDSTHSQTPGNETDVSVHSHLQT